MRIAQRLPLKDAVDRLSRAERRELLHDLEQTVESDFTLTEDQVGEVEHRDAELAAGAVAPRTVDEFMGTAHDHEQ